jgi:hypothetical protein
MRYGREAPEEVEEPQDLIDVAAMSSPQRQKLAQRILEEHPEFAELIPLRR